MQVNVKFSSKRFLLTLMLCACSVILLQNYNVASSNSFIVNILCMAAGLGVCFLMFIPAIIIKKRTDSDFLTIARDRTPRLVLPLAIIYSFYFVYVADYYLLQYTDLFQKKYYSEVSPCIIAFLLLAACVYAAFKGVNVITRFGIFLFLFAVVTNVLMDLGCLSSLDLSYNSFALKGSTEDIFGVFMYFITQSFIAVIFACLSGYIKNFKVRQTVFSIIFTGFKYAFVMFFVAFALGSYADRQEYQSFILSRVAHFGTFAGIESFFVALTTMSVFMIISLFLCCVNKSVGQGGSLLNIIIFSVIILAVVVMANYNNSIKEILLNEYLFNIYTFIAAVIIPAVYLFIGRKSVVQKN